MCIINLLLVRGWDESRRLCDSVINYNISEITHLSNNHKISVIHLFYSTNPNRVAYAINITITPPKILE